MEKTHCTTTVEGLKMDSPIPETTILDLNDDCMLEVFEHFGRKDLCSIADVCSRFRAIARAHFASEKAKAKSRCWRELDIQRLSRFTMEQSFQRASKYLRNFGAFMEKITVMAEAKCKSFNIGVIELLGRHCHGGGALVHLHLCHFTFGISEEAANKLSPALLRLETLSLWCSKMSAHFLRMLPLWSPELNQLIFQRSGAVCLDGLHQNFAKLESISFYISRYVTDSDIEELVKHNPQLKEIEIKGCEGAFPQDNIVRSIARHAPQIEKIDIELYHVADEENLKCFGKMTNLRSLRLCHAHESDAPIAFNAIAAANIPLEHLYLKRTMGRIGGNIQRSVDAISKLKNLKMLRLYSSYNLQCSHIVDLLKRLEELSEIELACTTATVLTWEEVLLLVRNANKLQKFLYHNDRDLIAGDCTTVDVDKFKQVLKIVEKRQSKLPLTMVFSGEFYTVDIPSELPKEHNNIVQIFKGNCF